MTVNTATGPDKDPGRIAGMFDAIAPRYDLLNHLLSAGIDRSWRARAIASLHLTGREVLLDVCAGTADVALEARPRDRSRAAETGTNGTAAASAAPARSGAARVVGVDFSAAMLDHGRRKVVAAGQERRIVLVRGDATALPVRTASVDAVSVAFGIRNVEEPGRACEEMARALRPGGRLAILEFGVPQWPVLRRAYLWYFRHVLPRIGRVISRHSGAYSYLPASVGAFPEPAAFMARLRGAGFAEVQARPLTGGIVHLYTAVRR